MVFIKTNLKRKCTKRKCTKRRCKKRKCTKSKSTKYGGKFTTNPNNEELKKRIIKYLQSATTEIGSCDARDIVQFLEYSPYEYDLNYVLQRFKNAVNTSRGNRVNAIYDASSAMEKEAKEKHEKEQQAKETQKEESNEETQKEESNDGCPSRDNEPVNCRVKKDYLKPASLFHPDKNPTCVGEATRKFQELQNNPTCKFVDEAVN